MGTIAYVRQVLDDTAWYTQAEPIYQANPTKTERLPYDRTEYVLSRALQNNETCPAPREQFNSNRPRTAPRR